MRCPHCDADKSSVVDSRDADEGRATRRRRVCQSCHRRFTTYERVEEMPLFVVKKDGSRETFSRDKLAGGMLFAAQKRPVPPADIEHAAGRIEREAQLSFDREVPSTWIGEKVMDFLRETDHVAYVRFASVYRSFRDVSEFAETADALKRESAPTA